MWMNLAKSKVPSLQAAQIIFTYKNFSNSAQTHDFEEFELGQEKMKIIIR